MVLAAIMAYAAILLHCGCNQTRPTETAVPPAGRDAPPTAEGSADAETADAEADDAGSDMPVKIPKRPVPRGRPAPSADCGHAVAFAGWRPGRGVDGDRLLVCDPGDNIIERRKHVWDPRPRDVAIHFGRHRPSIVLQPAGPFTVTGAIVIAPRADRPGRPRMETTIAKGMPDLSQDFSRKWLGLCGPTSAADVLYGMAHGGHPVLDGFARGPSAEAEADAARLITGGRDQITRDSLAGRMRVGAEGMGVTNEGLRAGVESWLEERNAGAWTVRLDWLDDTVNSVAGQRDFVGRLAAAVDGGGGAIVCLWPGSEFADAAINPQAAGFTDAPAPKAKDGGGGAKDNVTQVDLPRPGPTPALPPAEFPAVPVPPGPAGPSLPGRRPAQASPERSLAEARRKLELAEACLERGDPNLARTLASAAVELLAEAATRDEDCREALEAAIAMCDRIDARMPAVRPGEKPDRPTVFD